MNSRQTRLINLLRKELKNGLPGFEVQKSMAPIRPDGSHPHDTSPPPDCRKNGVMILLFPDGESLKMVLTVRSKEMPSHKGQISCPGGGIWGDETPVEAALRETEEETGVPAERIQVIGRLSDLYIPISGNILIPVVGIIDFRPEFKPDFREVSEILTPDIDDLLKPEHLQRETWTIRDFTLDVPFWNLYETPLWGATAMILSEFLHVYRRVSLRSKF